jgi:hypothetical protein
MHIGELLASLSKAIDRIEKLREAHKHICEPKLRKCCSEAWNIDEFENHLFDISSDALIIDNDAMVEARR